MVVKEILGKSPWERAPGKEPLGKSLWEGARKSIYRSMDERTGSEWVCLKIKSLRITILSL